MWSVGMRCMSGDVWVEMSGCLQILLDVWKLGGKHTSFFRWNVCLSKTGVIQEAHSMGRLPETIAAVVLAPVFLTCALFLSFALCLAIPFFFSPTSCGCFSIYLVCSSHPNRPSIFLTGCTITAFTDDTSLVIFWLLSFGLLLLLVGCFMIPFNCAFILGTALSERAG